MIESGGNQAGDFSKDYCAKGRRGDINPHEICLRFIRLAVALPVGIAVGIAIGIVEATKGEGMQRVITVGSGYLWIVVEEFEGLFILLCCRRCNC